MPKLADRCPLSKRSLLASRASSSAVAAGDSCESRLGQVRKRFQSGRNAGHERLGLLDVCSGGCMRVRRLGGVLAAAAIALSVFAPAAAAQITTGAVTGTVTDAQGGVVPGATV